MKKILLVTLCAAFAVGTAVGAQFVLTNAAQAQSTVVYLPITSSGVGQAEEVTAAGEQQPPWGGPISASNINEDGGKSLTGKEYASFNVGSGASYKRHVSVWQRQNNQWLGWYVEINCAHSTPTAECNESVDELIERYASNQPFWRGDFTLADLQLPTSNIFENHYHLIDHNVDVYNDHIWQTISTNVGTFKRKVKTNGANVDWLEGVLEDWEKQ